MCALSAMIHSSHMTTTSFYRRPLPDGLVSFASAEGRAIFREALDGGGMEGWFALSEQFHTQSDPAFCGLGTLVVALNALEIDPGRIWKGPWRWYTEDLLTCCISLDRVRDEGVTMDQLACLARCNGARADVVRPGPDAGIAALRTAIARAAAAPRGPVLVAAYSRSALGQTGSGHFSPIGGYHAARDLVLLMDVARFKYPPHWVPLEKLHESMRAEDPATGKPRGWIELTHSDTPLALLFRIALDRGDLTDARRAALDRLLTELRATPAWDAARAAMEGEGDELALGAAAALFLALPDSVLATVPDDVRAQILRMRAEEPSSGPLATELAGLRDQLHALACCAR